MRTTRKPMMGDSNELFELCKQVYEATRWTADIDNGLDYVWCHETLTRLPIDWDTSDFHQHVPLYTSDYLLEKLPVGTNVSKTQTNSIEPLVYYSATCHSNGIHQSDTPLKALLKLTLRLHEEEQL